MTITEITDACKVLEEECRRIIEYIKENKTLPAEAPVLILCVTNINFVCESLVDVIQMLDAFTEGDKKEEFTQVTRCTVGS